MIFKNLNSYLFRITSFIPVVWVTCLYVFLTAAIIKLGRYPIPSTDDPKEIGLGFLYTVIGIGLFIFFYGSILWLINLVIEICFGRISKKHMFLFLVGLLICLIQIFYDPGQIIYWYMD